MINDQNNDQLKPAAAIFGWVAEQARDNLIIYFFLEISSILLRSAPGDKHSGRDAILLIITYADSLSLRSYQLRGLLILHKDAMDPTANPNSSLPQFSSFFFFASYRSLLLLCLRLRFPSLFSLPSFLSLKASIGDGISGDRSGVLRLSLRPIRIGELGSSRRRRIPDPK